MKRASDYELQLAGLTEAGGHQNDMGDPLSHFAWVNRLNELRRMSKEGPEAAQWAARWASGSAGVKRLGEERAETYAGVLDRAAAKLEEFAAVMREFDDLPE